MGAMDPIPSDYWQEVKKDLQALKTLNWFQSF